MPVSNDIKTRFMSLHALTFLHPGTGQTTGVVDLPVQREVHTGFPMISSSGLKGSMRERAEQAVRDNKGWTDDDVKVVFGPKDSEAAGALIVSDARIFAFPVRSLQQVFVWVTCPMVINRLHRDLDWIGLPNADVPKQFGVSKETACPAEGSGLNGTLVLEELCFELDGDAGKRQVVGKLADLIQGNGTNGGHVPSLKELAFKKRLVVIHDEDFQYLVRHATQVSARVALNDKKTTTGDGGNLWYEETLPPETVMYALLRAEKPRYQKTAITDAAEVINKAHELLDQKYLQVGGNETVGQGWCKVKLTGNPATPGTGTGGGTQ